MFSKTKIALSAMIVLGTASAAFANTDVLSETQLDPSGGFETVVQPAPYFPIHQKLDNGSMFVTEY